MANMAAVLNGRAGTQGLQRGLGSADDGRGRESQAVRAVPDLGRDQDAAGLSLGVKSSEAEFMQ